MARTFLILHGVNGSGLGHWQTLLAQQLRQRGEAVLYPELSGKEEPDCTVWLAELREQLATVDPETVTVVCHSLSCILWMHHAYDRSFAPVDRLILVAPPSPSIVEEFRPTFHPVPMQADNLHASARHRLLIATNGDPRCPEKAGRCYGDALGIETVLLPDVAEHINLASGFGSWPGMAALCLSASGLNVDFVQANRGKATPAVHA